MSRSFAVILCILLTRSSANQDIKDRIAGIMSSGTGLTKSADITYMTPMDWLLSDTKEQLKEPTYSYLLRC
jgi:hypothetical protein